MVVRMKKVIYTLLKISKRASYDFSIDDSAMRSHFVTHLLSPDKGTKLTVHLPFFKSGSKLVTVFFVQYLSSPCSWDWF